MVRVGGIDPERLVVEVDVAGPLGGKGFPPVVRAHQVLSTRVDPLGVVGIDTDQAEIHGAWVVVREELPGVAPVLGAVQACASPSLHQRVDHAAVTPVHVQPDAAQVAIRQALVQSRPRRAAVERAINAASGSAPVEAPRRAPALVHCREKRIRVARIHDQVDGAGVLIERQDMLPGLPAVRRLEHAPLGVRTPKPAYRGDIHDVRVSRMDADASDVQGPAQAHVLPRAAPVRRLVDAVTPG